MMSRNRYPANGATARAPRQQLSTIVLSVAAWCVVPLLAATRSWERRDF